MTATPLGLGGVTKRWKRRAAPVLDAVNLELSAGTIVGVGGCNGAGKTTLLRIAAGMIVPDSGIVLAKGLSPERDRRAYHSYVSFLSTASSGLYARLTVSQHLRYQSLLDLLPKDVGARAIARESERLWLDEIDERRVDRLSMGQRQRLRLAMVMLRDPGVLLLDEPDNSLDDRGLEMLLDAVAEVVGRGGAVVWCSPTGEVAGVDFDRRLIVEAGKLVAA